MATHDIRETPAHSIRRICTLTQHHRDLLLHAIGNVCETEAARNTFAQVLDGVPAGALLDDGHVTRTLPSSHPSRTTHQQLCPGTLERLEEFRKSFDAETLPLDSQAMVAYQSAAPGSRLFKTRLIELVSRAIHQIAVELAFLDESPHKADGLLAFHPPESDLVFWEYSPDGPLPTWLHVQWYKNYKHYTNGSSDMIGYWAENYIIGGILLFERRHESSGPFPEYDADIDPDGVYIHSDRDRRTNRICKLLDTQKKEYLDFLQADTDDAAINSPLPLRPSDDSLDRVDPEEPALDTGIYRDSWERLPLLDHENDGRLRDVFTRSDYPRFSDSCESQERAVKRQRRIAREKYGQDYSD
ncbi:uncharacterized protein BBA_07650 [Beauveria bassiana ARSEF 2860]|uniref:Uncharacterized protein n=1 Tax=Beauveria bassiana (strain ARSEF 2860) TaxID=655819 RepID=J4KM77_BEAB2|nr:uncharacterized protein BBA_07650 [Beauveria bassiana ARSEF 2860]EJP63474.1 hypothetical protein BBA_07650 [Beauveria bassiana ARSEF 2860]